MGNNNTGIITKKDVQPALDHIAKYWQTLTRDNTSVNDTLMQVPNPYVVPSLGNDNFAFEEQYYWDSYFTSLGINDEKLVSGMLDNLIFLFKGCGLIPNANRYYLTSRSQPPILTTYIFHVYEKYNKPLEWLNERIDVAKQEYKNVWMSHKHPHARNVYHNLSRYYDINHLHDLAEAESGWDMTPRFKRQCLDYLPIDLNSLLFKYEMDFAKTASINNDSEGQAKWTSKAKSRQETVNKLMWSKLRGFYFDYNYHEKKKGSVYSLASYYTMWSGLATKDHSKRLVDVINKFDKTGGLATTTNTFLYSALFGSTKTQWAYPNGWAPLQFIVLEGLEKYGYSEQASIIAKKWLKTCNDWYKESGAFQEKYNVVNTKQPAVDGVYPSQNGFGWTNGVFAYLANKYL